MRMLNEDEEALRNNLNEIDERKEPDKDLLMQETDDDGTVPHDLSFQ